MKKLWILAACASLSACVGHLPSTQVSELDDVRSAIADARKAGAETCAPAELAKAEAKQLYAAHEIDEHSGYNDREASDLAQEAIAAAKAAKAKCAPKPVAKPKPRPVVKPTPKPKPAKPEVISLKGVFFEINSATLTAGSTQVLNQAVDTLNKRKDVKVEIAAHTDSRGKAAYNLHLSELRAQSVKYYLVKHGIDALRLTAKGYGETKPIADNKTKAGRAQNRRVEMIVK